jgi:DNA polymerase III alpha subunit
MLLNTHSYFSLRYGTISIEDIILLAKKNKYDTLAITDINTSTGIFDFVKACTEAAIKPIVGMEFRNGDVLEFIALAKNFKGLHEMNELLSSCNLNHSKFQNVSISNTVLLFIPMENTKQTNCKHMNSLALNPIRLNKIILDSELAKSKYLIQYPITYKDKKGFEVHKKLRAVNHNLLLSQLESNHMADAEEWFIPKNQLLAMYAQHPKLIENTEYICNNCSFQFDFKEIKNKKTFTGSAFDDKQLLRKLANDGLKYRYGLKNKIARERVDKELEIIDELGFSAYFLITWDIIRYSMSKGYYHVGRGVAPTAWWRIVCALQMFVPSNWICISNVFKS